MAVAVRFYGASIPRRNTGHALAYRDDLDAQLVAQDAWVGKERLVPLIGVQVGAADADPMNLEERFAGGWLAGCVRLDSFKPSGPL